MQWASCLPSGLDSIMGGIVSPPTKTRYVEILPARRTSECDLF